MLSFIKRLFTGKRYYVVQPSFNGDFYLSIDMNVWTTDETRATKFKEEEADKKVREETVRLRTRTGFIRKKLAH